MKAIPADKYKKYMDIADDAKEHAEHIGANAGKIGHQREHLALMSKDISDLITLFGSTQNCIKTSAQCIMMVKELFD
jgi:hypothetical protein